MERVGQLTVPPGSLEARPALAKLAAEARPWFRPGDPGETYVRLGEILCEQLLEALPDGWSSHGKRVLDFGCGAGRILRHLPSRAPGAEIWGCDIDRPSVEWLEQNLSPPLHVFVNGEYPPLPQPAGAFDLILVGSVFTHLAEGWSAWLLELRRLLSEDGLLVVTFTNTGLSFPLEEAEWHDGWDEDRIGMHVFNSGATWDEGGPAIYHSMWWIEAHWGRAFELLHLQPVGWGFRPGSLYGQGIAVMRRRGGDLTPDDLEAIEPGEPREVEALRYSLRNSQLETAFRRREAKHLSDLVDSERRRLENKLAAQRKRLARERRKLRRRRRKRERAEKEARAYRRSLSWRLTAPLRALVRVAAAGAPVSRAPRVRSVRPRHLVRSLHRRRR